ncbi:germ cell nuclear acidic protein [Aplochiton taeniatus]
MDGKTHELFQRVAAKLGWTEKGDLESAEDKLQLSDSDEDSGKENQGTNYRSKVLVESSDDDFDQFLVEKATPKAKALQRPCGAAKKVSNVPIVVVSSDSDGSFETFLNRVKTPKAKPKTNLSGGKDRNFIYESLSSDDDFVVKKKPSKVQLPPMFECLLCNLSMKYVLNCISCVLTSFFAVSKTPKPLSAQTRVNKPLSQCNTPVFFSDSEDDDGIVIRSSWRTRHRTRRPPSQDGRGRNPEDSDKEDSSPFPSPSPSPSPFSAFLAPPPSPLTTIRAPTASPAPPKRNYSAPSKLGDSGSSEEEFLSLLERLKMNNKTCDNTPARKNSAGPCQKVPVSAPPAKGPKAPAPRATGKTPLNEVTPVRPGISKPTVSQTEPRPSHSSRVPVCKTPGCFLQSLSAPGSTYVRSFKQKKEELTSKLYQLYNTSVFQDKLPTSMSVTWNKKMRKTAGYCITGQERGGGNRYARIELSEKVCDSADRLRDTLVHEMCHAATWLINSVRDGHGPFWKVYARKATLAHPELPMVTRCHSYDINYKYQYQCNRCQNKIGRHSKSLDTQRFVCALCTGQLVLLNPPKSRAPTPFANFVKENYGSVRQRLVGQSHAEVMRKLSADFASTRLSQT